MSKELKNPEYASQLPFVLMSWEDRDSITGKLLEIVEAVMPEGSQLNATKSLIKKATSQYWMEKYNFQFDTTHMEYGEDEQETFTGYCLALWREALRVNHSNITK